MLLYLAGSLEPEIFERTADRVIVAKPGLTGFLRANHFLFSFANPLAKKCAHHFCQQPQRRLFVDSGAYSVWRNATTPGAPPLDPPVELDKYIPFCEAIRDQAQCQVVFAALDVIPRTLGRTDKEYACDKGWDNYQTMKQAGIPCIMTFHQFENPRQLRRIMDDNNHFAVSIRKDPNIPIQTKLKWLKDVFRECDYSERADTPVVKWKIHGLGLSSIDWMEQLPFYSVDNTDGIKAGRTHELHLLAGNRVNRTSRGHWERLALEDGIPIRDVGKMLGFDPDGASEATGQSGGYWLQTRAMEVCVETEYHITKLWRSRGIDWPEQKDIVPAPETVC